jgi:hypothetical protein
LDARSSSSLQRNSLRIGEVFTLLQRSAAVRARFDEEPLAQLDHMPADLSRAIEPLD